MKTAKITAAAFVAMAVAFAAGQALAQAPRATYDGARPGNTPGTNNSLPTSDRASNINRSTAPSLIAPRLPEPAVGDSSSPREFLMAARRALQANRTGEAQEAMERAESRALDGNILASSMGEPSRQSMIQSISMARQRLAAGDRAGAMQAIDEITRQ